MSASENTVTRKEVRAVQRFIEKSGGRLLLVEHNEKLWATDSFFLVPATAVSVMLTWWNLPYAPGQFKVAETVTPFSDRPLPKIDTILALPEDSAKAEPMRIGGSHDALIRCGHSGVAALFETPGGVTALDDEKRRFVERHCLRGEWWMTGPRKAAHYVHDGEVTGVLMPIYVTWEQAPTPEREAVPA